MSDKADRPDAATKSPGLGVEQLVIMFGRLQVGNRRELLAPVRSKEKSQVCDRQDFGSPRPVSDFLAAVLKRPVRQIIPAPPLHNSELPSSLMQHVGELPCSHVVSRPVVDRMQGVARELQYRPHLNNFDPRRRQTPRGPILKICLA